MHAVISRKTVQLSQAADPKKAIFEALGDLSGETLFHNQIMVATFVRPEKTAGGIIRPDINIQEDEYQGKVGLVVNKGKTAFLSDESNDFRGQNVQIGDWVLYRIGDGWPVTFRGVACRILTDRTVRITTKNPLDYF